MSKKALGTLLTDSWSFFQKHFVVLLVGAVIFGVINGYLTHTFKESGEEYARSMMNEMNVNGMFSQEKMQKMAELSMKAIQGDEAAEEELEAMGEEMEMMAEELEGTMGAPEAMMTAKFAGMMGKGFLLSLLISVIAATYFLSVSVFGMSDIGGAVNKTIANVLPIFLLWIWIFIRTFVWIPVIGVITGIILGPRFIAAPLNLLEKKKNVFQSASMSYDQTKGLWGKIFGNMFVAGLLVWAAILGIGIALAAFGATGSYIVAVISQLGTAFLMVFGIQLARTIVK